MKLTLNPEVESVTHRVGQAESSGAGVSKDGSVRWVYDKSYLEVISTRSGGIFATWRFGKVLQDNQTAITAVSEIRTLEGLLLLVATSNSSENGIINIFSIKYRKVVGAIEIPRQITALEVVFENETEDIASWVISKHLQFFSGLLAVGTLGGYIYLVDLCLDELYTKTTTEISPRNLMIISPRIVDPRNKREQALAYDKHLALLLDEQCHRQEQFYYRRQDDSVQKVLDEETVSVTSLKYMEQAGSLAVGFNFGSFQLWRLYNPVLDYSSRYNPEGQAVTNFVVQEPENDPRNFVYLWVVHDAAAEDSVSGICLYQLSFNKKDAYANHGLFYDELESVCPRLDHRLTVDPYSVDTRGTSRSTLINCYTLKNPHYTPPAVLSDSFEEGFYGNDLSLSVFVWRADSKQGGRGTAVSHHWLSVFDMNQWYHAQMPHALRCQGASLQVCSFWAVYDLNDVIARLPSHSLLNVEVCGKNILKFVNNAALPPEEHSYPSALQLCDVHCVLADGSVKVRCMGWQEELLQEVVQFGAEHLITPADFYHQCLRARLLPQGVEDSKNRSTNYQRKVLLDMALERGLAPALIPQCIKLWEDGVYAQQGCTLQLLLNWAWESLVSTKNSLDSTCSMLYDWSGVSLDQRTDRQISRLTQCVSHIKQVLHSFTVYGAPTTERGQLELELRQGVAAILDQHFEVVRWAISSSLLPEIDGASDPSDSLFTFPDSELRQIYKKRRAELAHKKGAVDGVSLLMVDCIVECQGPHIKKVWESLGGDGMYPPPSMQAMMNMYLLEDVSLEVKHSLMLYFLRDLAALEETPQREMALARFIQRFMVSPTLVHHVQGLWFIDHHDFEEGVRQLIKTNVPADLCPGWRRVAVVNTLLAQNEPRQANVYMHSKAAIEASPQEQELYISVLIHNRQVSQALEYLRGWENEKTCTRLMVHLLKECQNCKLLGQVLQLNLTGAEEAVLDSHLRGRPEPHALEPLMLYYLHRSRIQEAYRLNQEMNARDKFETSLASQERSLSRNKLMDAYLKILPEVTRKMLVEKQMSHTVATSARRIQIEKPKPLSTVVRQADFKSMSQAQFMMAVIDKVNEAKVLLEEEEQEDEGRTEEMMQGAEQQREGTRSDISYYGEAVSPSAIKSLSHSARKTRSLIQTAESQEDKDSLEQLASECLQVLKTPVREHRRKSMTPSRVLEVPVMKTPQSILKVRRLSKTLTSSRENMRARRNSGSRSLWLGVSKSDTSHEASLSLPSSPTNAASPTVTNKVEKTLATETPKQLRFIGVSPSPTPSPSMVSMNVSSSSEKSAEMAQTLTPVVVEPCNLLMLNREITPTESSEKSAASTNAVEEKVPEEEAGDVEMEQEEEYGGECGVSLPVSQSSDNVDSKLQPQQAEREGIRLEERLRVEDIPALELEEGPADRYSEQLSILVRPDLQSPWKQLSPGGREVKVDEEVTFHLTSAQDEKEDEIRALVQTTEDPLASTRDETHVSEEELVKAQKTSSEIIERQTVSITSFSSTNVMVTEKEEHITSRSSRTVRESKVTTTGWEFQKPVTLEPQGLSSESESSSVLRHLSKLSPLQVETSPPSSSLAAASERDESPPATPPSSKRAKLMSSKGEDTAGLVESRSRSSPSPRARQRKTPERKSPARERKSSSRERPDSLHDFGRKTPERRSPARAVRKTPERKSPSRAQVVKLEETEGDAAESRSATRASRKTPERKSPARQAKVEDGLVKDSVAVKDLELTTVRKSPFRQTRQSPERKSSERQTRQQTPDRTSPARELESEDDLTSRTPETKSPGRQLRKSPSRQRVLSEDVTTEKSPSRELMKTPERKSPSRQRVLSEDVTTNKSPTRELMKTPERKSPSRQRVLSEDVTTNKSPSRELRKTPERKSPSRQRVLSEDVTSNKSPSRELRKTPERKSPSREVRKLAERKSPIRENVDEEDLASKSQTGQTPERKSATLIVRRSRQQSKTPDRLVSDTTADESSSVRSARETFTTSEVAAEPQFSLRRSQRQSKTPERAAVEGFESPVRIRKSSQQSRTPDPFMDEEKPLATLAKSSKRGEAKVFSTALSKESIMEEEEVESDIFVQRKSRHQSKTPERNSGENVELATTPTRRSRRQHKSPEVLNTDEIEPVSLIQMSPPKQTAKDILPEPATPPRMSATRGVVSQERVVAPQLELFSTSDEQVVDASVSRRSARRARSPEMLHTSDIQPLVSSPTRSEIGRKAGKETGNQEDGPPKPKKARWKRPIETDDDISLLVPSPISSAERTRRQVLLTEAQQKAAAARRIVKKIKSPPQTRRLIPSTRSKKAVKK